MAMVKLAAVSSSTIVMLYTDLQSDISECQQSTLDRTFEYAFTEPDALRSQDEGGHPEVGEEPGDRS